MAITEHASSPAIVHDETSASSVTTDSFTPPSGSIVVAVFSCGYTDNSYSVTISGSIGGAWVEAVEVAGTGTYNGGVTVAYLDSLLGGTPMTVTATVNNGGSGKGPYILAVKVLEGVDEATPVGDTAVGTNSTSSTTASASLTTSGGSVVYGGAHASDQGSTSTYSGIDANTTVDDQFYSGAAGSNIDLFASACVIRSAGPSEVAGTRNYGVSLSNASANSVALAEFLAADTGVTGTLGMTAPIADFNLAGDAEVSGAAGATAPMPTAEMQAAAEVAASLSLSAPVLSAELSGAASVSSALDLTAPAAGMAAEGGVVGAPGTMLMLAPALSAELLGDVSLSGTLGATAPAAGAQADAQATAAGSLSASAPAPSVAAEGIVVVEPVGTLDAAAPMARVYGEGFIDNSGALSMTAPMAQFHAKFEEPPRVRKPRTIIIKPEARSLKVKR